MPKALRPEPDADYTTLGAAARARRRAAELAAATSSTRSGRAHAEIPTLNSYPDPIVYKIDCLVRQHAFTTSQVLPIDANGQPTVSFDASGATYPAGTAAGPAAEHDLRVQRHVPRAR